MQVKSRKAPRPGTFPFVAAILSVLVGGSIVLTAQARRDFDVAARRYSFTVSGNDRAEIRVDQNDLVRVHFHTEDIPHSFTIEDQAGSHYRIMRRAEPGRPVSFDFRADTPGRFRFSCTLTIDPKCREMTGTIIVDPR